MSSTKPAIQAGDIFQVVFSSDRKKSEYDPLHFKCSLCQNPLHGFTFTSIHYRFKSGSNGQSRTSARWRHGNNCAPNCRGHVHGQKHHRKMQLWLSELLLDPKEIAEHVMLVDLGRTTWGGRKSASFGTSQS